MMMIMLLDVFSGIEAASYATVPTYLFYRQAAVAIARNRAGSDSKSGVDATEWYLLALCKVAVV